MAFLDNTGLERLWQHICAKFANREDVYQLQHPNILDNSNFAKLITYRASYPVSKSAYSTTLSFQFDRWRSSPKVIESEGVGLILQAAADPVFARLHQGMAPGTLKNTAYTVVLTLTDGTKYGGVIDLTNAGDTEINIYDGDFQFMLQKNVNSTHDLFRMRYIGTTDVTVANIGLYAGAYEVLPKYVSKLLHEERHRCLVFFRRINSASIAGWATSNNLRVTIPIEVPLRTTNPTLIVKDAGTIRGNKESVTTTTPELGSAGISEIVINVSATSGSGSSLTSTQLTTNTTYAWVGGAVGLDADFA